MTYMTELHQKVQNPQRLAALEDTALLDSPSEAVFDRYTRLATRSLEAPVALISLVDRHRQFFKSHCGLAEPLASRREIPLSHSFCQHVVGRSAPLIVEDARTDPNLCDNLAIDDFSVIAYLGIPLTSPQGQILGSFCVIDTRPRRWTEREIEILRDLATSVCAEIELRQLSQQVLRDHTRLQKLELQRDELVYFLVHDMRNALSSLMAGLDLIARQGDDRSRVGEFREIARSSGQMLLRMLSDILDVGRMEFRGPELSLAPIDPAVLVESASHEVAHLAKLKRIELTTDSAQSLPVVRGDKDKLRRVLVNLLSNAIHHTPGGGRITIAVTVQSVPPMLQIAVIDTGRGIPLEMQEKIFEKFVQPNKGESRRESSGLGLYFCKQVVEAHGGQIRVTSEPGQGSVFRFTLPYGEEADV